MYIGLCFQICFHIEKVPHTKRPGPMPFAIHGFFTKVLCTPSVLGRTLHVWLVKFYCKLSFRKDSTLQDEPLDMPSYLLWSVSVLTIFYTHLRCCACDCPKWSKYPSVPKLCFIHLHILNIKCNAQHNIEFQ